MTDKAYQVIDGVEGVHVSTQNCVVRPEIYILSLGKKKKKKGREGSQMVALTIFLKKVI